MVGAKAPIDHGSIKLDYAIHIESQKIRSSSGGFVAFRASLCIKQPVFGLELAIYLVSRTIENALLRRGELPLSLTW